MADTAEWDSKREVLLADKLNIKQHRCKVEPLRYQLQKNQTYKHAYPKHASCSSSVTNMCLLQQAKTTFSQHCLQAQKLANKYLLNTKGVLVAVCAFVKQGFDLLLLGSQPVKAKASAVASPEAAFG
jgi:hypothetical protein